MGWGANATGGRGDGTAGSTALYTVDNLNNSGPGSLRAALEASGKRVIVPRVGGYVETTSRIVVSSPNYTFLGQLAPGDGLAIKPASLPVGFEMLRISAGNGIVRYLRVRSGETSIDSGDCIMIYGANVSDVIFDHLSAAFATDGLFDLNGAHNRITIQDSALTYPLANAGHSKGAHDFGMLVAIHRGSRLSLLYNFMSQGNERWPYIQGGPLHQFIGNTVYNTQHNAILTPSTLVNNWSQVATINFQRNYYRQNGPRQHLVGGDPDKAIKFRTQVPGSSPSNTYHHSVYLEGNMSWHIEQGGAQSSMARVLNTPDGGYTHPLSEWLVSSPFDTPDIVWRTWDEARDYVAANAGASLHRDSLDQKAINEMLNNTGPASNPSSVAAAGGYPSLSSASYPPASDDVVASAWRSAHGETRPWYALTESGRMVIEDYADDIAQKRWSL